MANAVMTPVALTATVVAVSTPERMKKTAAALSSLRARSAVRTIQISLGDNHQPQVITTDNATTIEEIVPRYLNNAVAALRLSSLPSIAWWRGGDTAVLPDLAHLVDRLVLDAEDPAAAWSAFEAIREVTVVSDLRWAGLTRWRNLLAQFFDIPDVGSRIASFAELELQAADRHTAALLAGWLKSRLPAGPSLGVRLSAADGPEPIRAVSLNGEPHRLTLELLPKSACIKASVQTAGTTTAARIVPAADLSPEALLAGELRIRARDVTFEQALAASMEVS